MPPTQATPRLARQVVAVLMPVPGLVLVLVPRMEQQPPETAMPLTLAVQRMVQRLHR